MPSAKLRSPAKVNPSERRLSSSRSRSPARNRSSQDGRNSVKISDSEPKSLPKTPQKSPVRQSQRLLGLSPDINRNGFEAVMELTSIESVRRKITANNHIDENPEMSGQQESVRQPKGAQNLETEPKPAKYGKKTIVRFGGILDALKVVLLAYTALVLVLLSSLRQCRLDVVPKFPEQLRSYLDVKSVSVVAGWIVFQFLVALVPVGSWRLGQPLRGCSKRVLYRCNAWFALLVNIIAFRLLYHFDVPVFLWLRENFLSVAVSAFALTLCISVCLYVRARNLPHDQLSEFGNTGNFFHDFYVGKELNPRFINVDLKTFFIVNIGLIGWMTLIGLTVFEAVQRDRWNGNLLLVMLFQSIYILDNILFQGCLATTKTVLYDGLGFNVVFTSLLWQPFISSIQVRDHLLNEKAFNYGVTALSIVLFGVGYFIYRCSSYQKDLFRRCPQDALCSDFKTIRSGTDRPLLCTFWWSICRHPNYLGMLLMVIGWSLPSVSVLSYILPLLVMFGLLFRIHDVESVCLLNHKTAWGQYSDRVKSRLIPLLY